MFFKLCCLALRMIMNRSALKTKFTSNATILQQSIAHVHTDLWTSWVVGVIMIGDQFAEVVRLS